MDFKRFLRDFTVNLISEIIQFIGFPPYITNQFTRVSFARLATLRQLT